MNKKLISIFFKRNGFIRHDIAGVIVVGPHLVLAIIVTKVLKWGTAARNHGAQRKASVLRLQLILFQMARDIPGLIRASFVSKVIRPKIG